MLRHLLNSYRTRRPPGGYRRRDSMPCLTTSIIRLLHLDSTNSQISDHKFSSNKISSNSSHISSSFHFLLLRIPVDLLLCRLPHVLNLLLPPLMLQILPRRHIPYSHLLAVLLPSVGKFKMFLATLYLHASCIGLIMNLSRNKARSVLAVS
jgi:hypothetical protein